MPSDTLPYKNGHPKIWPRINPYWNFTCISQAAIRNEEKEYVSNYAIRLLPSEKTVGQMDAEERMFLCKATYRISVWKAFVKLT